MKFDICLLSKYRTELMGISIIGVLIMHICSLGEYPHNFLVVFSLLIPTTAFTETFLLLSGLGIYRSLSNDANQVTFYRKRVNRIIIPYLGMAIIPVALYVYINHEPYYYFVYRISTLDFWIGDGCLGMWYVAVSLMLYTLSPPFFKYHFFDSFFNIIIIILALEGASFLINKYFPAYWETTWIWIAQSPAYFIGGYIMNLIIKKQNLSVKLWIILLFATLLMLFASSAYSFIYPFSRVLLRLLGAFFLCMTLCILDRIKYFRIFMKGLRWFGKYSLELYVFHLLLYQPFKNSMWINNRTLIICSVIISIIISIIISMHSLTSLN